MLMVLAKFHFFYNTMPAKALLDIRGKITTGEIAIKCSLFWHTCVAELKYNYILLIGHKMPLIGKYALLIVRGVLLIQFVINQ